MPKFNLSLFGRFAINYLFILESKINKLNIHQSLTSIHLQTKNLTESLTKHSLSSLFKAKHDKMRTILTKGEIYECL